jgi:deazaflavin-dependent oxidoreductase (nitroreductase family)
MSAADTSPRELPEWIRKHVEAYLATDGREGHLWDSRIAGGPGPIPTLLLTTTGRKSGRALTLPLIYTKSGEDYVVIASRGGHPTHPAWYLNLVADPVVDVQVLARRFEARARTASASERAALWKQMRDIYPPYDAYQARAGREIPVVLLRPI